MLSFLFIGFLLYLLFRLLFDFVLPIYRTTKKVKQSFREMNQRMHEQNGAAGPRPSPNGTAKKTKEPVGDYIDFEEVKD